MHFSQKEETVWTVDTHREILNGCWSIKRYYNVKSAAYWCCAGSLITNAKPFQCGTDEHSGVSWHTKQLTHQFISWKTSSMCWCSWWTFWTFAVKKLI